MLSHDCGMLHPRRLGHLLVRITVDIRLLAVDATQDSGVLLVHLRGINV